MMQTFEIQSQNPGKEYEKTTCQNKLKFISDDYLQMYNYLQA